MHPRVLRFLTTALAASFACIAHAAPGEPDLTFGVNGAAQVFIGESDDALAALIQRGDGRIVAIGRSGDDIALARYLASGALDTSFSRSGLAVHRMADTYVWPLAAAQQPDGRIVVLANCTQKPCVFRFNADGSIDASLDPRAAQYPANTFASSANGLALQPDGGILITTSGSTSTKYGVFRLLPTGQIDTAFGVGGRAEADAGTFHTPRGVLVQPDGRIVVVTNTQDGTTTSAIAAARFGPEGSPDASFSFASVVGAVHSLALQPDGKLIIAGCRNHAVAAFRFNPDGSPDLGFGTAGAALQLAPQCAGSIALRADGRIVMGIVSKSGLPSIASEVMQLTPSGALDSAFGRGGHAAFTAGGNYDAARTVLIQADGNVVAGGEKWDRDFALVRYTSAGVVDATFGTSGIVVTDFLNGRRGSVLAAGRAGEKLILVAAVDDGLFPDGRPTLNPTGIARLLANGTMDESFGIRGQVTLPLRTTTTAVLPDGRVLLVENDSFTPIASRVRRVRADGTMDPEFASNGVWTLLGGWLSSIKVMADGRIVMAGRAYEVPGQPMPVVARLLPDGAPDTTFGTNGVARFATETYSSIEVGGSLAIQGDGRIVVGNVSATPFSAMRLLLDGRLDPGFGIGGIAVFRHSRQPQGRYSSLRATLSHTDGRITLAGFENTSRVLCGEAIGTSVAFVRTNPNGGTDMQTAGAGYLSGALGPIDPMILAATLDADDRVVAAGTRHIGCQMGIQGDQFRRPGSIVLRFTSSGALDTRFGKGGVVDLEVNPAFTSNALSLSIEPDGRILVAATTSSGRSSRFVIYRLEGGGESAPIGPPGDIDSDSWPNDVEMAQGRDPFVRDEDLTSGLARIPGSIPFLPNRGRFLP